MADSDLTPEQIPFGQDNPSWISSKRPSLPLAEIERKKRLEYSYPDASKETPGPLEAWAVENSYLIYPPFPPELSNYQNVDSLVAVKAIIVEQHRGPHPDEEIEYDDGTPVPEAVMLEMVDTFYAASSDYTDPVNKGDKVLVDYANRLKQTGPKYYGLKFKSSNNSGKTKDKRGSKPADNTPSLANTTTPPGNGSPVPQAATPSINGATSSPSLSGKPGLYQVAENGKTRPPDDMEMVIISGTSLLYPKKYIKALDSLRAAYKSEKGETLGIVSAYRDVALQEQLYSAYLKRNKADPQVAPPGFSLHNNGRAVDLATGNVYNNKYTNLRLNRSNKDMAFKRAAAGEFGPIAQWLSQNSERFGFRWAGYSFRELWHYELDIKLAKSLGLIE